MISASVTVRRVGLTRGRYHACLISCAESLDVIRRAKDAGLDVTCGVSINHLTLNENDIGPYRTFFKMSPPLRAEDDRVVVEVSDTGVGIGAEDREKIFLPFFTTKPSGTGLGMSIVKKIVDLHGGDIAVESAPGRGTRVRIALPAAAIHPIGTGGES